jgi:hypothetical protein
MLPIALIWTGTSLCSACAIVTGIGGFVLGLSFLAVQAEQKNSAAESVRIIEVCFMVFVLLSWFAFG